MIAIAKALWFIENRFDRDTSLAEIASACGLSRFHLTRAFGIATGYSVMRYVRGRRLTEAARILVDGAPDILTVALQAGYGSHEAFTRAFHEQFGVTPEVLRSRADLKNIKLVEPIRMNKTLIVDLEEPRIEDGEALLIAGFGGRYSFATNHNIPLLWQRFSPHIGVVPGQVDATTYGVCCNPDGEGNFEYIAGVGVSGFGGLNTDYRCLRIPAQHYAVFSHRGHISTIRSTVYTIWNKWLPESRYEQADGPDFERYDERFDANLGTGLLEIWVPIREQTNQILN